MRKILKIIKIYYRDRRIIREIYKHQITSIKIKENKREAASRKGVRQGCDLSPLLFNIQGVSGEIFSILESGITDYSE
jgi:retron-type reverse transcriptase